MDKAYCPPQSMSQDDPSHWGDQDKIYTNDTKGMAIYNKGT